VTISAPSNPSVTRLDLHGLRSRLLLFALLVLAFAFCGGIGNVKPIGSVQIINTNAGRIETASADEYDHVVYVSGLAYRPSSPGIGAHVHAWGVDKNNNTVFFKTSSVEFNGKFTRTSLYVVAIDPTLFSKATKVFVTLHRSADAESLHSE
jgi:hypothetical protein